VKRTALVAELKGFLRPQNMDTYGIVLGPHGSGKSTAIREALRSSGPQGAVYFMAPTSEEDTGCLSKLLDADPVAPSVKEMTSKQDDFVIWRRICPLLATAVLMYEKKYRKPVVLIFDNINFYAKYNPKLLERMQLFAKDCADARHARIIFVGSESLAIPIFQKTSAFSRSTLFTSQLLDITDAEAAVYLMVKYNLPMFRSRALVKLVAGGRFSVLNKIGYFPATKPLRQIISPFWKKTRDSLDLLRLDPTDRFFFALVTKTTVASLDPVTKHMDIAGLLRLDIITQDPDENLSFHSRHVLTFFLQFHERKATKKASKE
jgi:hypothetical protein